jgi:hypothetical protein
VSEAVFHKIQLGRQSVVGTGVAATTVFPADAGFLGFELDRASESPNEDFGSSSREQPGRRSTGVRGAQASLPFVGRFQDLMHILEMHVAGSVAPTGSGPYVYTYTFDDTADTIKYYTVQYGDENSTQDEWRAIGVLCNELEFGFDALSSPGNSMWQGTAGLLALDRAPNAMTGSLSAPATLETMEGHLSTLAIGSTATAFASLTDQTATLKSFRFTSTLNAARRAYGGTSDTATAYGRSDKGEVEWESLIKITSGTKTSVLDVFEVAGSLPTEQRFRVSIDGSGNNVATIDFRSTFTSVDLGDHEGEHLYLAKGVWVKDATLGGRGRVTLTNDISAVP